MPFIPTSAIFSGSTPASSIARGIVSLTRAVAREAAPDVRVNAIAPGPVETDLLEQTPDEQLADQLEIPARRAGQPQEIAPTALFLASDDASYYFGQVLSPSGGAVMR